MGDSDRETPMRIVLDNVKQTDITSDRSNGGAELDAGDDAGEIVGIFCQWCCRA